MKIPLTGTILRRLLLTLQGCWQWNLRGTAGRVKPNGNYQPLEEVVKAAEAEGDSVAEGVAEEEVEAVATKVAKSAEKVTKVKSLLDPMDQKIGRP